MTERTTFGPGGEFGDSGLPEPISGAVEIAIPPDLAGRMKAIRWWIEEEQRANEDFLFDRAEAIRRELLRPSGLLYSTEFQVQSLTALLTGS